MWVEGPFSLVGSKIFSLLFSKKVSRGRWVPNSISLATTSFLISLLDLLPVLFGCSREVRRSLDRGEEEGGKEGRSGSSREPKGFEAKRAEDRGGGIDMGLKEEGGEGRELAGTGIEGEEKGG